MKKRILAIILFLGFLFFSFYLGFNTQNYSYNENFYIFNTSKIEFKNIGLIDTYKNSSIVKDKIAPGTKGAFYLLINENINQNQKYQFIYKENHIKPNGLYFVFEGNKYDELHDLIYEINTKLNNKSETIKIEWYWDFKGNDNIDTLNGMELDIYNFEIALIPVE